MSEYEYEKVEGLKAWEIMKLHEEGTQLYTGKSSALKIERIKNIEMVVGAMNTGNLYTHKEKPWWAGCEGSIIMVRDCETEDWLVDIFEEYNKNQSHNFVCYRASYAQARPLTAAERYSIKVID